MQEKAANKEELKLIHGAIYHLCDFMAIGHTMGMELYRSQLPIYIENCERSLRDLDPIKRDEMLVSVVTDAAIDHGNGDKLAALYLAMNKKLADHPTVELFRKTAEETVRNKVGANFVLALVDVLGKMEHADHPAREAALNSAAELIRAKKLSLPTPRTHDFSWR